MKKESFGQFVLRALWSSLKDFWWPYVGPYSRQRNAGLPGNHAIVPSLLGALIGIAFRLSEVLSALGFTTASWWATDALAGILLAWAMITIYVTCQIAWYTWRNVIMEVERKTKTPGGIK